MFAKRSQRGLISINMALYGSVSRDELGALFEKFMPLGESTIEDYGWVLSIAGLSKEFVEVPDGQPTPKYLAIFHQPENAPVTVSFERDDLIFSSANSNA